MLKRILLVFVVGCISGLFVLLVLFACNPIQAPVEPMPARPSAGQSSFAPARGYWVEVTSITQSMETIAIFLPADTTQAEDVVVISSVVEGIHKDGKSVLVFICLPPEEAVFVLPNISCKSLYWFPLAKIAPIG